MTESQIRKLNLKKQHFSICANKKALKQPGDGLVSYLYLHGLGLHHIDFVLVATPNFIMDNSHAAHGLVGLAQLYLMVVVQIPLPICHKQKKRKVIWGSSRYIRSSSKKQELKAVSDQLLDGRWPKCHQKGRPVHVLSHVCNKNVIKNKC